MSYSQQPSTTEVADQSPFQTASPLRHPRSLSIANFAEACSSLAALILAILVITTGEDWLRPKVASLLGGTPSEIPESMLDPVVAGAYEILQARSYVWVLLSLTMFILFINGRSGSRWVAILSVFPLLFLVGITMVELGDEVQPTTKALAIVSTFAALCATIGYWAPATRKYAAAKGLPGINTSI
ncbi:hypothetical protein ACFQ69_36005 [Streptomyces sp. NPDC056470]|uniref:hypothetical protein n=1 Tax=Streptomyces sp. NPDC056470 TaxID=3345831 RepID=UPI0036933BE0